MQTVHALETFVKDNSFFIKFFLLDGSVNLNHWGVSREALLKNLHTFKGTPFVITENFGHPNAPNGDALMTVQEVYRKGDIIDVGFDEKTGKAWGVAEIKDKDAQELIKSGKIKFVSPAITFHDLALQKDGNGNEVIIDFKGAHVAGVKDPAFGILKAQIKGQCNGASHECKKQLMMVQACSGCGVFQAQDVQEIVNESLEQKLVRIITQLKTKMDLIQTLEEKYGSEPDNEEVEKEIERYKYDLEWLAVEYIRTKKQMRGEVADASQIVEAASKCVSKCLSDKKDAGKEIDDQAIAICLSECGESKEGVVNYDCPECGKKFKTKKERDSHIAGKHMYATFDGKWLITSAGTNNDLILQFNNGQEKKTFANLTSCGNMQIDSSYKQKFKQFNLMTENNQTQTVKIEDVTKLQEDVKSLTDKVASLQKEKQDLVDKLDAERKKPVVEKIVSAKVILGKIKEEGRQAEFDKLIKRDQEFLEEMSSEYTSIQEARKVEETKAKLPYTTKYSYASTIDPAKGDQVLLALRGR